MAPIKSIQIYKIVIFLEVITCIFVHSSFQRIFALQWHITSH